MEKMDQMDVLLVTCILGPVAHQHRQGSFPAVGSHAHSAIATLLARLAASAASYCFRQTIELMYSYRSLIS